jgi:Holliday junction resolvase RusA-like endonuclease
MTLAFTVYGVPQPKGNISAFVREIKGMKVAIATERNRSVKGWSQLVAQTASDALAGLPPKDRVMLDGPVRLTAAFYLPRPKHLRQKPAAHLTTPDWDKLARAIGDALSQVIYEDDKQIVEAVIGKFYAEAGAPPRVDVRVESTSGLKLAPLPPAPMPLFEDEPHA